MAILDTPGPVQPSINPTSAAIGNVIPLDPCPLTAEDWAAIEEGARDADAGRFVSDEDMTWLLPGW